MMDSYEIKFDQLRQNPGFSEMLSALERGFQHFGIDYYLVGAVARDVWMSGINNIAPRRTTGDIDFAVLINDKGLYEKLVEYLVQHEDFQPYRENSFVLIWKDKMQVDLLPFGAVEDEDGKVSVKGTGFTSVDVPGFKEIYEEGLPELSLENEHQFKFCTLPGIVLLKLLAWEDRPEARRDDIKDISDILNHFFNMYDDEIWKNHNDLFAKNEEADLTHIACRVMGREIAKIAKRNEQLYKRIAALLKVNTTDERSAMGIIMVEYFKTNVEDCVELILHLKKGFAEI